MRPSERRDVRQELRGNAESVALALHDSMAEVNVFQQMTMAARRFRPATRKCWPYSVI